MKLQNRVSIVTGASSGVGAETAVLLAKHGMKVIVNYFNNEAGALKTQQRITQLGGIAEIYKADISIDKSCRDLVNFCIEKYNQLDVLINNAGTTHFVPHDELELLSDDIWHSTLNTNLIGPFYMSRAAVEHLKVRCGGEIVMTSSIAGLTTHGSSIAYCASKAGLNSLTKTLAKSLGKHNIRVNAICPGLIDNEWSEQGWGEHWQQAKEYTLKASAINHISKPEDVAAAIAQILMGPDNLTGQIINLDSGLTL